MPKWKTTPVKNEEDYFVSGIWTDQQKSITHMMLHKKEQEINFELGEKTSVEDISKLVEDGAVIRTIRWSYIKGRWVGGMIVKMDNEDGKRTVKSAFSHIVTDRLDHLIVFNGLFG